MVVCSWRIAWCFSGACNAFDGRCDVCRKYGHFCSYCYSNWSCRTCCCVWNMEHEEMGENCRNNFGCYWFDKYSDWNNYKHSYSVFPVNRQEHKGFIHRIEKPDNIL